MPVLFIAALVVPADALLNNVLVPRTNALADELKRTEIKGSYYKEQEERQKAAVWYRSGRRVLEAARFDPSAGTAENLSIYELGEDRLPISRTDAASARHVGQGWWLLESPTRIVVSEDRVRDLEAPRYVDLGETLPAEVDTMHLSLAEVGQLIDETEADGVDTTSLRVDFHVKFAQSFACIVLPAVVLFFRRHGTAVSGAGANGAGQCRRRHQLHPADRRVAIARLRRSAPGRVGRLGSDPALLRDLGRSRLPDLAPELKLSA